MKLYEFVTRNAKRGSCGCGKCFDAPLHPHQPDGHTADLVFFKVAIDKDTNKDTFIELVEAEFPHWLDGKEYSYIEMGANIGDQGIALMTMGMGFLLGVWELLTPRMLGVEDNLAKQMAGMGFINIKRKESQ